MSAHPVKLDWSIIRDPGQLWDEIVRRSGHPEWHGRNLDALRDGWVVGGLDDHGPPYDFCFIACSSITPELSQLAESVMATAAESVDANGGSIEYS